MPPKLTPRQYAWLIKQRVSGPGDVNPIDFGMWLVTRDLPEYTNNPQRRKEEDTEHGIWTPSNDTDEDGNDIKINNTENWDGTM